MKKKSIVIAKIKNIQQWTLVVPAGIVVIRDQRSCYAITSRRSITSKMIYRSHEIYRVKVVSKLTGPRELSVLATDDIAFSRYSRPRETF